MQRSRYSQLDFLSFDIETMPPFEAWFVHHSRTRALALSHSRTLALSLSHSLTHSLTHSLSLLLALSLSLSRVQVAANSSNFLDRTFSVQ